MAIVFAIPAPYRKVTGNLSEVRVAAGTVAEAISGLNKLYPDMAKRLVTAEGALNPYVSVYVNGEHLHGPEALGRPLKDGDRLVVMPVIGGGH